MSMQQVFGRTMENPYFCNPFAGVICSKCKYPLNSTFSLENEIHRHEVSSKKHDYIHGEKELKQIVEQINREMRDFADTIAKLPEEDSMSILQNFLNEHLQFPFCSICKIPIADKRIHKRGIHFKACSHLQDGCKVKSWDKNDPKVVKLPIDYDDSATFCPEFWHILQEKRISYCQNRGNDPELLSPDNEGDIAIAELSLSPAQIAFDAIILQQNERFQFDPASRIVQIQDQFVAPNLWLLRSGYDVILQGLNMIDLHDLSNRPLSDDEESIRRIKTRIDLIVDEAVAFAQSIDRSNMALMEVKRIDHRPSNRPFNTSLKQETWQKYKRVLEKVVTVLFRLEIGDPSKKRYRLTDEQEAALGIALVDDGNQQSNQFYMNFLFSLMRQRIVENSYDSVLLYVLAVISVKRDANFMGPNDVTPLYAAMISLYRTFILFAAHTYPINPNGLLENTALLTDEMMIHPESSKRPGPMAWIFHTFSYAKVISQNMLQPARCYWDNDILVYRGSIQFSMVQFRLMLNHFIAEAKRLIATLLLLPDDYTDLDVPKVHWECIVDDPHNCAEGYSFLNEPRNMWISEKHNWLCHKIRNDPDLAEKWYDPQTNAIKQLTLDQYSDSMEKLRRMLFGLIHFTSGQPGRGTEISNLRFENTTTPRNIIVDRRLVAIRTSFHKNMLQTDKPKNIYRYLPPSVGEILVQYLWLILPFYQLTKGSTMESREKSKFLWSKDHVYPKNHVVSSKDLWETPKLSSILNNLTKSTMGVEMNMSSWRHIAIAISRRFLRHSITDPSDEEDDFDGDDMQNITEEDIEIRNRNHNVAAAGIGNIYDLQAAHSSRTAFRVYARSLNAPNETPSNMIDAFRRASIEWHKLLFPDLIVFTGNELDDPNDSYRSYMLTLRRRRLTELANVDLTNRLRLFLNESSAVFRGNQKEVLEAVIRGDQVVLQVAATGSGKSYSFLIPAFCSPDGTTIVIEPLVSIQKDMMRRCREHNISARIWSEIESYDAPMLLFVSPESAVSKSFLDYVALLSFSHKIDRIVLDECHSVLSCDSSFRSKLADLKHLLQRTGVQVLLLTATLPSRFEASLIRFLGLERRSVSIYRTRTSRENIQYVVINASADRTTWLSLIRSEVKSNLCGGKCIIYCRRREDGYHVSSQLSAPYFHSQCGSDAEKAIIIDEFRQNGSIIVATNAFGLGVDIAEVSLVIHVGSPRSLLDFVQESGRAGRDGRTCKSVLLSLSYDSIDEDMHEFIHLNNCRRCVIDKHMDGIRRPHRCLVNERPCDLCSVQICKTPTNAPKPADIHLTGVATATLSPEVELNALDDDVFLEICNHVDDMLEKGSNRAANEPKQISQEVPTISNSRKRTREDAVTARFSQEDMFRRDYRTSVRESQNDADRCLSLLKEVENALSKNNCMQCYLQKTSKCPAEHSRINSEVKKRNDSMTAALRKRGFPPYTACFGRDCFLPQSLCQSWEALTNGGFRKSGKHCRFSNVLLPMIFSIILQDKSFETKLHTMMKEHDTRNVESLFTKEVPGKWNGIQMTYLFVAFFELLSAYKAKYKVS